MMMTEIIGETLSKEPLEPAEQPHGKRVAGVPRVLRCGVS